MKLKIATLTTALMLAVTPMASAGVIDRVDTTADPRGTIYHVTPSQEGRSMGMSGSSYNPTQDMREHGIPVTPSLGAQLVCHIVFAGSKPTWNLEDWRPKVSDSRMIATQCNP